MRMMATRLLRMADADAYDGARTPGSSPASSRRASGWSRRSSPSSCGRAAGAIRTALLRLEHDGLVVRERNRGARVRRISAEEAVEILEARAALESLAAGYAARAAHGRRGRGAAQDHRGDGEAAHAPASCWRCPSATRTCTGSILEISRARRRAGDLRAAELAGRALPVPDRARAGPAGEVAGRAPGDRRGDRRRRSPGGRGGDASCISLTSPRRCWRWLRRAPRS